MPEEESVMQETEALLPGTYAEELDRPILVVDEEEAILCKLWISRRLPLSFAGCSLVANPDAIGDCGGVISVTESVDMLAIAMLVGKERLFEG